MRFGKGFPVATVLVAAALVAAPARAQATRTWVSGVGDDANPCSRTAPCKTFAGAISKTAAGGEINALDPGGFGAVTITKAITIDGGGGRTAGVLVSGTNGIVVNAGASDLVTLRNLDINGLNTGLSGVRFLAGKALHVEHCIIYGFTVAGIDFEPAGGGRLTVRDVVARDNSAPGFIIGSGSATELSFATLTHVRASDNATGVLAKQGSRVTVLDSEASSNCFAGFATAPTTAVSVEMNIQRSRATLNAYGVKADDDHAPGTAVVRLSDTAVTENGAAGTDATGGGSVSSFGNNQISANGAGSYEPNVAPGFDVIPDQSLAIGAPAQTLDVTNVTPTASGPLEAGQGVALTATSDTPGLIPDPAVSGTGSTRTLTYQPIAGESGAATITVSADDGQCINHLFTRTFAVTVAMPNVAPTFFVGPNEQVAASSGPATFPGWATGVSPGPPSEAWQTVAFVVTTASPGLFAAPPAIDASGTLTFTPQAAAVGQTLVTVVLRDNGGTAGGGHDTSAAQTFLIAIGQQLEVGTPTLTRAGTAAFILILALAALLALGRARLAG